MSAQVVRGWIAGLVTAALVMAAAASVDAQAGDPFTGVWRLNVEKSLYEAGRPPRPSPALTRTAAAG